MAERAGGLPRGRIDHPQGRVDVLLSEAALRSPARPALRTESGVLSYRELDDAVDRWAAYLGERFGPGCPIAVCTVLDPAFAIAFYAVSRSGNVIVTVNPLLPQERLTHMLAATGARAAFVPAELRERIEAVRGKLPDLTTLIVIDGQGDPPGTSGDRPEAGPPADLPGTSAGRPKAGPPADPDSVACLQFTSGTTGAPKAVMLSHRNLLVNAAQVAAAHRLSASAITLNHLPAYHLMHLNSGVHAGVTQVLCRDPDPVAAVEQAARHGVTHFYGLPARLIHLSRDPRLAGLRLESVRGIFSGGAALPVAAAKALYRQFGIPVIQGYGLAETSPLTHCDVLTGPRWGSVGPPVAATECRVVDVRDRTPLPPGSPGEVEVRGPQVMLGYRDADTPVRDGWLPTADIGYQDADGWLFIVDRIKDVFKCDNELVSPSDLERLLDEHTAVRDCVVVDHPDDVHGAVAHALVVLAEEERDGTLLGIASSVNDRLPYYHQIRYIQRVPEIPRPPSGKLERRTFRGWMDARATFIPFPSVKGTDHGAARQQDDGDR